VPYQSLQLSPSLAAIHYGQSIFEGVKAYKDQSGNPQIFRPKDNFKRFNISAARMQMPAVPESIFIEGMRLLIDIECNWIPEAADHALYIRPFMFATEEAIGVKPSNKYKFLIILSPTGPYYAAPMRILVEEKYVRAVEGGFGFAKAAGNYSAQFYPTKLANEKGFQQVIWTDDATHTKMEESGTMNVFFRIKDTLYTAPTSERILDGVTRKSLIASAERDGIEISVRPVLVAELVEAAKNGTLKEIFGAGTAAVVTIIKGFSYQEVYYELPAVEHSFALDLKNKLTNIQHKLAEDTFGWTVKV
jgi:branched-chain amino acid aminotransferase